MTGMQALNLSISQNSWCLFRHEHLYNEIPTDNIITSNEYKAKRHTTKGCRVILTTLSTLSSISLQKHGFLKNVPLQILVIDEASQVERDALQLVLSNCSKNLQKICLIGDNKQCEIFQFLVDNILTHLICSATI